MEYTRELHEILEKNNLFAGLTSNNFKELSKILSLDKFREGDNIVVEGEQPDKIYVILKGRALVLKTVMEEGSSVEHDIAVLNCGDSIGDVTLIDRQPRSATVRALENTETISFEIDHLSRLSHQEDSIEAKLKINFALRLSQYLRGSNNNTLAERKKHESEITQLTNFDVVTGLPNQYLFKDKLIAQLADFPDSPVCMFQIEVTAFKDVCDAMGQDIGDQFLTAVSSRLSTNLPEVQIIARIGYNHFMIMSSEVKSKEDIIELAKKIIHVFLNPFRIQTDSIFTNVYVGVTLFPEDGIQPDALIKNAGLALDASKLGEPNSFVLYNPQMNNLVSQRHQLVKELYDALEKNQFELYYQPQVDLLTGELIGVESLIRWIHPEKGIISPGVFIPIVEQTGMIIQLGHWIFETACKQAKTWVDAGHPLRVAINLSSIQFMQKDLSTIFEACIKKIGVDPKLIELEITESVMMSDIDETIAKIQRFVDMGFIIAIDDFGTGYSSLSYLRRLPIHKIKIDQSFVKEIGKADDAKDIVRCIVGMAKGLRLDTIAEGIEEEEQKIFLQSLLVDEGQGYIYSKPIPAESLEKKYFQK